MNKNLFNEIFSSLGPILHFSNNMIEQIQNYNRIDSI